MELPVTNSRMWLYERLKAGERNPSWNPTFALAGTRNWMKALAMLCPTHSEQDIGSFYRDKNINVTNGLTDNDVNYVFERLVFAFHDLSALKRLSEDDDASTLRAAIVTWYYTTYHAAAAMVMATSKERLETHTSVAKSWQTQVADRGFIPFPFSPLVTTLVQKEYEAQISSEMENSSYNPATNITTAEEARDMVFSYLKGSAQYYREDVEQRIRKDREFKVISADNSFRKRAAQEFRDNNLKKKGCSFLHQAFRYRGKANYRDAIFLAYGNQTKSISQELKGSLSHVAAVFLAYAAGYCAIRVGEENWERFISDLQQHLAFETTVGRFLSSKENSK